MNLDDVWDRYEKALEARPSKGDWTGKQAQTLADSVADIPGLLNELDHLHQIHDLAVKRWSYWLDRARVAEDELEEFRTTEAHAVRDVLRAMGETE